MTPPVKASLVAVREGVEAEFRQRHAGNPAKAQATWRSLVAKRAALLADVAFGPMFTPPKLPRFLKDVWPLRVLKGLPHGFRAVYTVFRDPLDGLVVQVEWVGDHDEYDKMFGYATS